MIKETEIVSLSAMTLVGIQPMNFTDEDGKAITGCRLYWLYPKGANPDVDGCQTAAQFISNSSRESWIIGRMYEPNIKLSVVGGKPTAKIAGYKLVEG